MRIPLAVNLETRDGSLTKDAKVVNAIIEPKGEGLTELISRPGNSDLGLVRAGATQGAYYFNGQIVTVHGSGIDRASVAPLTVVSMGTVSSARSLSYLARPLNYSLGTVTISASGTATATATSTVPHYLNVGDGIVIYGSSPSGFDTAAVNCTAVLSSTSFQYTMGGALTATGTGIALVPRPAEAWGYTASGHGLISGQSVVIAGATTVGYNGTYTITVLSPYTFSYAVASNYAAPVAGSGGTITATPATAEIVSFSDNGLTSGSTGFLLVKAATSAYRILSDWTLSSAIGANYPASTVPGSAFLDGYFFVMDANGTIWNCDLNADPATGGNWKATSFIKANKASGAGVYLTRSYNYVVALKEFSTEVFYDAGNPSPGSPLSPVDNAFSLIGCASAGSVARVEDALMWISQAKSKGRGVYVMRGAQQQRVSTPDVDRILDLDSLSTVYAYGLTLGGHVLYVLTLVSSNVTLVYDLTTQQWMQWSSLTPQTPATINSITRSGTTVTVTFAAAHSLNDGDPLLIAGATPSAYNGIWQVSYVSTTVVTFEITGSPASPATGSLTGARYVESYFKFSHYVNAGGNDILLHESDGHLYQISPSLHQDAGNPINFFTRSTRMDGGDLTDKKMSRMAFVGDALSDYIMVRWSDDDSQTFNKYKRVDLSLDRPRIRRCGSFRRRSIETRFIGNNQLRLEAIELEVPE